MKPSKTSTFKVLGSTVLAAAAALLSGCAAQPVEPASVHGIWVHQDTEPSESGLPGGANPSIEFHADGSFSATGIPLRLWDLPTQDFTGQWQVLERRTGVSQPSVRLDAESIPGQPRFHLEIRQKGKELILYRPMGSPDSAERYDFLKEGQ